MTTGIEKKTVYKRIRQNKAYNTERLKLLFGIIYRNPDTALKKWKRLVEQSGFDSVYKKQRRKASYLGKQNGKGFFGFYSSRDRQKSEHANAEFHKMARTWYGSVLEEEEVVRQEAFTKEQLTKEENQKIIEQARARVSSQFEKLRASENDLQTQDGAKL